MSQLAVYGAVESVPIRIHVDPPAGARSNVTCWTSVEESDAVADSATVPPTGVPGSVRATVGASVSTLAVVVVGVEVLPTLSLIVKV